MTVQIYNIRPPSVNMANPLAPIFVAPKKAK